MTQGTTSTTTTTRLANNATVISTVESTRFDNGVTDVSIIPYMRSQGLQFAASNLRPNRRVYFFFDDVNVDEYILQTNEVTLEQNNDVAIFNAGFSNADILTSSSNTAQSASLVQATRFFDFDNATPSLRDDAKPRRRRRILRWANSSLNFANAENFTGSVTGITGTVAAVRINSVDTLRDFFQNSNSNTITLPAYTSSLPNNYWGTTGANTIALIPRQNRRRRTVLAYIGGFDNVSRTLFLQNTAGQLGLSNNNIGRPGEWVGGFNPAPDPNSPTIGGPFRTDFEGKISGTFIVPAGTFRTGDRIFRIIDDRNNDPADSTTRAEYRFTASGLQQTKQDTIINDVTTVVVPPPPSNPPRQPNRDNRDPIAQTFFVDSAEHPNGVFISAVGLYFYNKDEILPVTVQIRPTVNGFPHSSKVMPYSESTLDSEYITTSEDASVETKIKFDVPIYLEPGEYALVVKSDSLEYEVFVAELGSKIIGTDRIVSKQPYLGSFFKSQNASTWDAVQLEDLAFNLYKCVFGTSGSVTFFNEAPTANAAADTVYTHIDDLSLPNTTLAYAHSLDGGSSSSDYIPDTNFRSPSGRVTFNTDVGGQYRLSATLSTNDTDISPVIYNKTGLLNAIENIVDNADLEADDISIVDPGYYPGNANGVLTVTITDYRGGTQAIATANVNAAGNIANIIITSAGAGFINTATANISQTAGTTAATFKVASELDLSGGPIQAKHISRSVTLAEGFDAGDLRVFLTAYKPLGTDIKVYYKVKAADDSEPFADKSYVLMNQKTRSSSYSSVNNFNDSIEYEFEPFDATNSISYSTSTTTYTTFNQFAFKVALLTDDTSKVPIIYDMRAIALPAMST